MVTVMDIDDALADVDVCHIKDDETEINRYASCDLEGQTNLLPGGCQVIHLNLAATSPRGL